MCRVKLALRSRFSFEDVRIFPVIRGSVEEEKVGRDGGSEEKWVGRKTGRGREERTRGGGEKGSGRKEDGKEG